MFVSKSRKPKAEAVRSGNPNARKNKDDLKLNEEK
jgi:hypothetical protein